MMLIRIPLIAAGLLTSYYLVATVMRSKRRLDRRVEEFREEQESGNAPPLNPYAALAELYAEEERNRKTR